MREIKFRAWDGEKMLDGNALEWDGVRFISGTWNFEETHIVADLTNPDIMQFTGLLDCKGKEIFESDLLDNPNGIIHEAYWNDREAAWMAREILPDMYFSEGIGLPEAIELGYVVVDNVHQDPELLEPPKEIGV